MYPILPEIDSFDIPLPIVPGWIPIDIPLQAQGAVRLLQGYTPFGDIPAAALPPSAHQRIFAWPAAVGSVSQAGYVPGTAQTPAELAAVWTDSILSPLTTVPMPFDAIPEDGAPAFSVMPGLGEPRTEIYAMQGKAVWTARPDDPIAYTRPSPVLEGSSTRLRIAGVTRDGTGAALGSCTVSVVNALEFQYANDPDVLSDPVVAITTSDVSGNFAVEVRTPGPYQLMGYKSGSPDLAGITVNTVTPVAV